MREVETGRYPQVSEKSWPKRKVLRPFVSSAQASRRRGIGCSSPKAPPEANSPKKSTSTSAFTCQSPTTSGPLKPRVSRTFRASPPYHHASSSMSSVTYCAFCPLPRPKIASCMNMLTPTMPRIVIVSSPPGFTSWATTAGGRVAVTIAANSKGVRLICASWNRGRHAAVRCCRNGAKVRGSRCGSRESRDLRPALDLPLILPHRNMVREACDDRTTLLRRQAGAGELAGGMWRERRGARGGSEPRHRPVPPCCGGGRRADHACHRDAHPRGLRLRLARARLTYRCAAVPLRRRRPGLELRLRRGGRRGAGSGRRHVQCRQRQHPRDAHAGAYAGAHRVHRDRRCCRGPADGRADR